MHDTRESAEAKSLGNVLEDVSLQQSPFHKPDRVRRSRAKRNLVWEQNDRQSGGIYMRLLHRISKRFPVLTPTELQVCTLIHAMLPSHEIADRLHIREQTVENHRVNIRRKLGLAV